MRVIGVLEEVMVSKFVDSLVGRCRVRDDGEATLINAALSGGTGRSGRGDAEAVVPYRVIGAIEYQIGLGL